MYDCEHWNSKTYVCSWIGSILITTEPNRCEEYEKDKNTICFWTGSFPFRFAQYEKKRYSDSELKHLNFHSENYKLFTN